MIIRVAVNTRSVQSGVASLIPVLHGVVTRMSMCLDSVHLFKGNEILFHCGFFTGLNHDDERALLSWRRG